MLFEKIKVFYGQLASEKIVDENLVKKICEISDEDKLREVLQEEIIPLAKKLGYDEIGSEHILLAIIKEGDYAASRLLNTMGISLQKLFTDVLNPAAAGQTIPTNQTRKAVILCWYRI